MNKETLLTLIAITSLFYYSAYQNQEQNTIKDFLQTQQNKDTLFKEFEQWKQNNFVQYSNEQQESYRRQVFYSNTKYIENQNSIQDKYRLEINKFADITSEEFAQKYLSSTKPSPENRDEYSQEKIEIMQKKLDEQQEFTWKDKGVLTEVVNQGNCDASYAFSSVGILESYYVIQKLGPLTQFSAQQIISCNNFGAGCEGASVKKTLEWIEDISSAQDYPYVSFNGDIPQCQKDIPYVDDFYWMFFYTSNPPLRYGVATLAYRVSDNPVSSGIDGHHLQFYKSGIFDNCGDQRNIDMIVVGFTKDYWELKAPFGTNWGEQGYLRIAMGNNCGITDEFYTPTRGF